MVIVHVDHVHIVCGYGMLTSSNESETITNLFYIQGIHLFNIINAIIAFKDTCVSCT